MSIASRVTINRDTTLVSEVLNAQNTADLSGSPLTAIDDQIFPTNLADVVTDGTFCVRNTPADVAAFGLADHVDGDVLKKVGTTWKRLLRPVAGTTIIWLISAGQPAVFVDEPVAGSLPVFVRTVDVGEAFSVAYIGTNLPGQISFDGTLLIGNNAGGLTEADFGNATVLLLTGTLVVWIRDTVNPERSGVYNLIVNDAGTGDYTLRRDYNFRDSSSFTDGQTFFVGSGSGGDEANKNFLISLAQQFILNTTSLSIVEGDVANLTTKNLTTTNVVVHEGIYHEIDADGVTINKSNILSNAGFNDGIARTANRVDVYQGTGITSSITNQSFVAGVAAVSNPTLDVDAGVFAVGDLVLITDTPSNNGLFEIGGFAGSTATLRGVGTIATVEDFTRDQLISGTFSGNIRLVNVSVHRTSLTGTAEHGQGNLTPISFKQLAILDEVPSAAVEEFSSTIVRFFGGFGLPDSTPNGTWTLINPAEITLVQDTVFGEANKQVVNVKDTNAGIGSGVDNFVSGVDFQNAFDFGAEFGGIVKAITPSGSNNYFFIGVGVSGVINPTASTADQRFGAFFKKDPSTNFVVLDDLQGATNVILNGTGGVPLVEAGDYFEVFVSIDIGFIDPRWIVNGIDVGAATFGNSSFSNNVVTIQSGSSGGVGNDFNVANFGITILEESTTKTIANASMTASDIQVITPVIERDFEVIVPDGFPRPVGSKITVLLNNVGGKFKIRTQNLSSPQSLFNRRRELEKIVNAIKETRFLNIVDNNNVYEESSTILNQEPLESVPGSINYDPVKGTMNVRNIFPGSSIQVGQESVVFVVNNTGATIGDGKIVSISGYDAANDAMEITLAIADTVENTEVLGMVTTKMIDGQVGLITVFGRVNDLDTTSFVAGDVVYLSDTSAGDITATRPAIPIQIGHVGKIDALIGFIQIEVRELEKSIFGGYSHTLDQTFTANVSAPIQFNTNEQFSGIAHSETVNNDEFTFTSGGVYQATAEPQYTRTTGGGTDVLNMFLSKDTGAGFVTVPNTNVKFSVNTAGITNVSPLTHTFRVNATNKIRFMAQVESANLILDAVPASGTAPNDIPLTPSILMSIVRIGD